MCPVGVANVPETPLKMLEPMYLVTQQARQKQMNYFNSRYQSHVMRVEQVIFNNTVHEYMC